MRGGSIRPQNLYFAFDDNTHSLISRPIDHPPPNVNNVAPAAPTQPIGVIAIAIPTPTAVTPAPTAPQSTPSTPAPFYFHLIIS